MMSAKSDQWGELKLQIMHLKAAAETLAASGQDIPAVKRNVSRVLASVKMLELNVVDALEDDIDA